MDVDRLSDEELLRLTPTRPEAFGAFYRRHESDLLAYMLRRTRDPELAADLSAEAFAAALVSVRRFRPGPQPAIAWLFGIARNVLGRSLERRRVEDRARRRLGMPRLELSPDVLDQVAELEGDSAAVTMLSKLPDDESRAVRARVLEGATYTEIAADMQCSEQVIRKRVSRGLARLRGTEVI